MPGGAALAARSCRSASSCAAWQHTPEPPFARSCSQTRFYWPDNCAHAGRSPVVLVFILEATAAGHHGGLRPYPTRG
jgi:hypothetical protein